MCLWSADLTAIARPATRTRTRPDFHFRCRERSGRVLNAARRLAVIPEAFHGPLIDYAEDAHLTVEREMEEALFGREGVDSLPGDSRRAVGPTHGCRPSHPRLAQRASVVRQALLVGVFVAPRVGHGAHRP